MQLLTFFRRSHRALGCRVLLLAKFCQQDAPWRGIVAIGDYESYRSRAGSSYLAEIFEYWQVALRTPVYNKFGTISIEFFFRLYRSVKHSGLK